MGARLLGCGSWAAQEQHLHPATNVGQPGQHWHSQGRALVRGVRIVVTPAAAATACAQHRALSLHCQVWFEPDRGLLLPFHKSTESFMFVLRFIILFLKKERDLWPMSFARLPPSDAIKNYRDNEVEQFINLSSLSKWASFVLEP